MNKFSMNNLCSLWPLLHNLGYASGIKASFILLNTACCPFSKACVSMSDGSDRYLGKS